jgi:hypothetical protein
MSTPTALVFIVGTLYDSSRSRRLAGSDDCLQQIRQADKRMGYIANTVPICCEGRVP